MSRRSESVSAAQARTLAGNDSTAASAGSAVSAGSAASVHASSRTRINRAKTCFRNSSGICLSAGRQSGRRTGGRPTSCIPLHGV